MWKNMGSRLLRHRRVHITKSDVGRFLKRNRKNLVAVAFLLLLAGIAYAGPKVAVASMISPKEIPIYCVDREDKVVALTFDAAWVEVMLLE